MDYSWRFALGGLKADPEYLSPVTHPRDWPLRSSVATPLLKRALVDRPVPEIPSAIRPWQRLQVRRLTNARISICSRSYGLDHQMGSPQ